ncbi:MAG: sigma-70 family RNA polymerase sigma factor [Polyangiaceae bacterium]
MTRPERAAEIEANIASALAAKDWSRAATEAIRAYGPEILGFLVGAATSEGDASEIFSQFCEDLWKGLPGFRGTSSFRTWAYVLARHAAHRFRRDPYRKRSAGLSSLGPLSGIAENVESSTLPFLRSEVKNGIRALRDELPPEDRELLILRVDRDLDWTDVARVFAEEQREEGGPEPTDADLSRLAATLRKRYERVKKRLRDEAVKRGLVTS